MANKKEKLDDFTPAGGTTKDVEQSDDKPEAPSGPPAIIDCISDEELNNRRRVVLEIVESLETELDIDVYNLHGACAFQSQLALQVGQAEVEAKYLQDLVSNRLKQVLANVELRIRQGTAEGYHLSKMTESTVKSLVEGNEEVVRLRGLLARLSRDVASLSALRSAFDTRRDMLRIESQLYTADYWTQHSEPEEPPASTMKRIAEFRKQRSRMREQERGTSTREESTRE